MIILFFPFARGLLERNVNAVGAHLRSYYRLERRLTWLRCARICADRSRATAVLRIMWTCGKCGERLEDSFDSCWKCSTPRPGLTSGETVPPSDAPKWRVTYEIFKSGWLSWDELFKQATEFASELGPERVLNISHSEDQNEGVVVVWYWTLDASPKKILWPDSPN